MSKKFYTADLHLGHVNVIKYCGRPFKCITDHDTTIIENWNKKVGKNDLVYVLGDFTMVTNNERIIDWVKQLNGHKFLIKGNHDKNNMPKDLFVEIADYKEVHDFNRKIILFHYAIESWQGAFGKDLRDGTKQPSIHLHGHSHGLTPIRPNRYDVGVDCWNFSPVTIQEILNGERDKLIG